jgi:hypothetical protein
MHSSLKFCFHLIQFRLQPFTYRLPQHREPSIAPFLYANMRLSRPAEFHHRPLAGSVFTAPAFRAGIRMANPPGKGAMQYPPEWRQGAEAFGRNYGDAFAQRVTFQTGRFATGVITHEDPRYIPSSSHNVLARSLHALTFTFLDRSDSGRPMPAFSNFGCHSRRIRWECISSFRLQQHHTCRSAGDSSVRVHRCGEPVSRVCAANAQTHTHGVPANCSVMAVRVLRRRT